jgi:hypothetical protein
MNMYVQYFFALLLTISFAATAVAFTHHLPLQSSLEDTVSKSLAGVLMMFQSYLTGSQPTGVAYLMIWV